jgi:hypothetical protein
MQPLGTVMTESLARVVISYVCFRASSDLLGGDESLLPSAPIQRRNSSDQSLRVVLPGLPASSSSRAAEYLSAKFRINAC